MGATSSFYVGGTSYSSELLAEIEAFSDAAEASATASDTSADTAAASAVAAAASAAAAAQSALDAAGAVTGVATFEGRSGAVVATAGDYEADEITFTPAGDLAATDVQAALEELDSEKAASTHAHAISDVTGLQAAIDGKQPLDASLTAYAALTTAANKGVYYSSADTPVTYDLTSYGRSIGGVADEASFKALVNLEIGTDVQAYDAGLAAYAALTTAANKGIYYSGSDTPVTYDLTSYGRSIGGVADEASFKALVNLEIGTDVQAYDADTAKLDVAQTWTAVQSTDPTAITDNTTWSGTTGGQLRTCAVNGSDFDVVNPSALRANTIYVFRLDFTTTHTVNWGTAFEGTLDASTDTAGAIDYFFFIANSAGTALHFLGSALDADA